MIELYHNDMSTCSQKVRLTLAEKGLEWESRHLNLREADQQRPDYLKLNPNGVVPTLVDGGTAIIESTVINEYIDDAWPDPPLRPQSAPDRARMRLWTKQLDEGLHAATGVISTSIAYRHQRLETKSRAEIEAYLERMPDAEKRERQRENIFKGLESSYFQAALKRFDKLLDDMQVSLSENAWLAGDTFSLADAAYIPYATRLDHLHLSAMWAERPAVADWYARATGRASYGTAITEWINPAYMPLMKEKGQDAWPRIAEILGAG